jgi:hypothetical protein
LDSPEFSQHPVADGKNPGCQPPLGCQPVDRLTESSLHETASSAKQSAFFAFSAEGSKILRTFACFLGLEGTGEAQIPPSAAHLGSILSVENRAGALLATLSQKPSPGHRSLSAPFPTGLPFA